MKDERSFHLHVGNDAIIYEDEGIRIRRGTPQVQDAASWIGWIVAIPLVSLFAGTFLLRGLGATQLWMFPLGLALLFGVGVVGLIGGLLLFDRIPWTPSLLESRIERLREASDDEWAIRLTEDTLTLRGQAGHPPDHEESIPVGAIQRFEHDGERLVVHLTARLPDGPPSVGFAGPPLASEGGLTESGMGCAAALLATPALWMLTVFLLGVPLITPLGAVCGVLSVATIPLLGLWLFAWRMIATFGDEHPLEVHIRSERLEICRVGSAEPTEPVFEGDLNATFDARGDTLRITRPDGPVLDLVSADAVWTALFLRREREKRLAGEWNR